MASFKNVFSMTPREREEKQQVSAASHTLASGAQDRASEPVVSVLQPPENPASFGGDLRLVPASASAQNVGTGALVTVPARPVTCSGVASAATVGQLRTEVGHSPHE